MRSAGTQTQTTTSAPPAYIQPYLNTAAYNANQQFMAGGTPVTGYSAETHQAMDLAKQRALAGSPLVNTAQNFTTDVLSGGMMGQNPALDMRSPFLKGGANPYLDSMFNRAAGQVTNQIQSNFGRAGRNVRGADAAGLAGERMNDLASQIYGGAYESDANRRFGAYESMLGRNYDAYEAERARQQQLVPFAGQLAAQDYADIGQLANVGSMEDQLKREVASAPARNLDEFLMRLQGFPGGTVTSAQPMERNVLSGALGGSQLGSSFGPWGMLGGAVLGGLFG